MAATGVLVGLAAEAACLAGLGDGIVIARSGARPERALCQCESLIAGGAAALVSFGIAGALVPGLEPGALLLPERVVTPAGAGAGTADRGWHQRVAGLAGAAGLAMVTGVALAGSDHAVTGVAAKAALARTSGAAAVDMESHIVAAVARRHGLPFLVVRAIADPADRAIPGAALAGLGPDGETRPWAVVVRLLASPWSLPALLRLAADSKAGLTALAELAGRLGPAAFRLL